MSHLWLAVYDSVPHVLWNALSNSTIVFSVFYTCRVNSVQQGGIPPHTIWRKKTTLGLLPRILHLLRAQTCCWYYHSCSLTHSVSWLVIITVAIPHNIAMSELPWQMLHAEMDQLQFHAFAPTAGTRQCSSQIHSCFLSVVFQVLIVLHDCSCKLWINIYYPDRKEVWEVYQWIIFLKERRSNCSEQRQEHRLTKIFLALWETWTLGRLV